ncbi:hypothetical protein QBE52_00835 [Clostridiaceae bacterium 35-E11]
MKLKRGIYEQVINEALNEQIKNNIADIEVCKKIIDHTHANKVLSTYLSYVFKKGLNHYKSSKEDVIKQINIADQIINMFSNRNMDLVLAKDFY